MYMYGPKKAGRNNGVAVIRGNCGFIVNIQQKRLNLINEHPIRQNNENLLMKTCSYGVIVSMICNTLSIAEFVAVMQGKITKKIGVRGSQNLGYYKVAV